MGALPPHAMATPKMVAPRRLATRNATPPRGLTLASRKSAYAASLHREEISSRDHWDRRCPGRLGPTLKIVLIFKATGDPLKGWSVACSMSGPQPIRKWIGGRRLRECRRLLTLGARSPHSAAVTSLPHPQQELLGVAVTP